MGLSYNLWHIPQRYCPPRLPIEADTSAKEAESSPVIEFILQQTPTLNHPSHSLWRGQLNTCDFGRGELGFFPGFATELQTYNILECCPEKHQNQAAFAMVLSILPARGNLQLVASTSVRSMVGTLDLHVWGSYLWDICWHWATETAWTRGWQCHHALTLSRKSSVRRNFKN